MMYVLFYCSQYSQGPGIAYLAIFIWYSGWLSTSQGFIVDIDSIQAHGRLVPKPSHDSLPFVSNIWLGTRKRNWGCGYYKTEGEWLLYRCCMDPLARFYYLTCLILIIICLPQSVHGATRKTLLKIKGFSEIKVEKVKEAVQKCLVWDLYWLDICSWTFSDDVILG